MYITKMLNDHYTVITELNFLSGNFLLKSDIIYYIRNYGVTELTIEYLY